MTTFDEIDAILTASRIESQGDNVIRENERYNIPYYDPKVFYDHGEDPTLYGCVFELDGKEVFLSKEDTFAIPLYNEAPNDYNPSDYDDPETLGCPLGHIVMSWTDLRDLPGMEYCKQFPTAKKFRDYYDAIHKY